MNIEELAANWKSTRTKQRERIQQYKETDPRNWTIHRNRKGWPTWYQRYLEAYWIITGKWSLHKAWQDGVQHGTKMEYHRTVIMKGG